MNYLITGYTGFVGKNIVKQLITKNSNNNFFLLSRNYDNDFKNYPNVKIIICDLTKNFDFNLLNNVDIFLNFAGEITDENKMYELHVNFIKKCFEFIETNKITIYWLQLSSVGSYGLPKDPGKKRLVKEDYKLQPTGQYETTKSEADLEIIEFNKNYDRFSYCIVRPSQIIGKDMINRSLLNLIEIVKARLYFTIRSKKSIRSYVHIEDLCKAIFIIIKNKDNKSKNKIYNISQNILLERIVQVIRKKYKIKIYFPFIVNEKLIRILIKIFGSFLKLPITNKIISGLVARSNYSSNSIKSDLNFEFDNKSKDVILKVDE